MKGGGRIAFLGRSAVKKGFDSVVHSEGSHYFCTSTSFEDVDATDLSLTIITKEDASVLILASFTIANDTLGGSTRFDFDVDGSRLGSVTTGLIVRSQPVADYLMGMTLHAVKSGLSAGSHTFKLQWSVGVGTQTTMPCDANWVVAFSVVEL